MSEGKRPMSVGFWFSLGHSSIVFALATGLSLGIKALVGPVRNDNSALHHYTGLIGTSVSGAFLLLIAIINIVILAGILKVFREIRSGTYNEAELEDQLNKRGWINRIFGYVYHVRLAGKRMKAWNKRVYYLVKYLLIGGIVAVLPGTAFA